MPLPVLDSDHIAAWVVELPLLHAFSSATTDLRTRQLIVIRLRSGDSVGWGEAAPVPGHSQDTVADLWSSLQRSIATFGLNTPQQTDGMMRAAFAQAGTDLAARVAGVPLWRHLGGNKPVWASAAIGLDTDGQPDRVQIESALADGYRHMKLKITGHTRIETLAALLAESPAVTFGVDANGSLDLDDEIALGRLDALGLSYVEQPGGATDLEGHRKLRARMATPISLDESAYSVASIEQILAVAAADIINLKSGRFGTSETMQLAKTIVVAGQKARLGGLIESGIGRGHTIALATNELFAAGGDIAGSDRYFADDLVRPQWRVVDGQLRPSAAPGLGVDIDETALARFATESLTIS